MGMTVSFITRIKIRKYMEKGLAGIVRDRIIGKTGQITMKGAGTDGKYC